MKTTKLPEQPDAKSPAGADIRTVPAMVDKFWQVLEGRGQIGRDNGCESSVTLPVAATSIDIPAGKAFQYRNVSDVDLQFLCTAIPS